MTDQKKDRLDFVDAVIHELKTSVTAIIVSVELLGDELRPEEKSVLGRLIQSITRNARSIDERLSLLSETGEMISGNAHFQPEPIQMKEIIQNVATQLYPTVQSKRQSLTLEIPDSIPAARADRQYLEQILLTLMTNASKFTPEEGKIKVSVRRERNKLIVRVSDTGIGIPAEEQDRIFEPYYQVNYNNSSQTDYSDVERRKRSGGLGLAIAKFLIELHRGKIWLESEVGQGSSFFFSLPAVAAIESSSN
jgi:two-component system clock-associated histidine kinase SasA